MKYTGELCPYCGKKIFIYGKEGELDSNTVCCDCFLECCDECFPDHECIGDGIPEEDS